MAEELRVDMRKLSPAAQEVLRMRVMAAIDDGLDDDRAAALFGVSTKSISSVGALGSTAAVLCRSLGADLRLVDSDRVESKPIRPGVREAVAGQEQG